MQLAEEQGRSKPQHEEAMEAEGARQGKGWHDVKPTMAGWRKGIPIQNRRIQALQD